MLTSKIAIIFLSVLLAITNQVHAGVVITSPDDNGGIKTYTTGEVQRVFLEHLKIVLKKLSKKE